MTAGPGQFHARWEEGNGNSYIPNNVSGRDYKVSSAEICG